MSRGALILTYHAIEEGPAPLCLEPDLFRAHLDCLADLGAATLTISELSCALRAGELPPRAVAITFDDGCASAARVAAPMLAERGQKATFFCVSGYLGGWNNWPTQPRRMPRLALASGEELGELAQAGFELGAHGMEHAPLADASAELAWQELHESKIALEGAADTSVRSFAYPYGVVPSEVARALANELYIAACAGTVARVVPGTNLLALPRVDVHYIRRPATLKRAVAGSLDPYLRMRGLAGRIRRNLR